MGLPLPVHRTTPSPRTTPMHSPPILSSSNGQQIVYLYNVSSSDEVLLTIYNVCKGNSNFFFNFQEKQSLMHSDEFPKMAVYMLGLMSTCIAFVVLIIQVKLILLSKSDDLSPKKDYFPQILMIVNQSLLSEYGIGIWTGLSYGISGIMAIFSAHKTTTCT